MKWLTIPQIKRRSKTAKGALKVSHEHWNQLYTATAKELREERERTRWLVFSDYCGLCTYNGNKYGKSKCTKCIFRGGKEDVFDCGGGLWTKAEDVLSLWIEGKKGDWHAWKRACKAVRDKLKELMELK